MVNKGLLDGRKVALLIGKALNGLEVLAVHLGSQHQAAVDQYAVNDHGAGTALAGAAAFLGTGQVQHIADDIQRGLISRYIQLIFLAVYKEINMISFHFSARSFLIQKARPGFCVQQPLPG